MLSAFNLVAEDSSLLFNKQQNFTPPQLRRYIESAYYCPEYLVYNGRGV